MEKHKKELVIAKIETLRGSMGDPVVQTLCDLLIEVVNLSNSEEIGFKK